MLNKSDNDFYHYSHSHYSRSTKVAITIIIRVLTYRAQQKWWFLLLSAFSLIALNKSGNLYDAQVVPRLSVLSIEIPIFMSQQKFIPNRKISSINFDITSSLISVSNSHFVRPLTMMDDNIYKLEKIITLKQLKLNEYHLFINTNENDIWNAQISEYNAWQWI